jgi:steroid 5-alpha reductase family enzyme
MDDTPEIHRAVTWILIALALVTFAAVTRITAPYGRHHSATWGPTMPARLGWILMETPAVLVFAWIYMQGQHRFETVPLLLLGLWQFHYIQRTYVFPFRMRNEGKRMPVLVCALAAVFQLLNAYVNARWISHWGEYAAAWLHDPRLWIGVALFFAGWLINFKADAMLFALRKPGESGYKIPRGWLYEYVSCPNYLGEILEWIGWAIATWSLAGLGFALYTAANIGPRALANHRWYRNKFEDYPPERKALIPFVL